MLANILLDTVLMLILNVLNHELIATKTLAAQFTLELLVVDALTII